MIVYAREPFTPEEKLVAVRYVVEKGCPVKQAAKELFIPRSTLYRWVAKFRQEERIGCSHSLLTFMERCSSSDPEALEKARFEEIWGRMKELALDPPICICID